MAIPTAILAASAAASQLDLMGVKAEELHEAGRVGYTHASVCTDLHPRSLAGTEAWGWSLWHLRKVLLLRGWTVERERNFETVRHPRGRFGIAVAAADGHTGRNTGIPQTTTPRGPATLTVVEANRAQTSLPLGGPDIRHVSGLQTWFFLHHHDARAEEVRLELSLPYSMVGEKIDRWLKRIVVPSFSYSTVLQTTGHEVPEEEVRVDVPRRAQ